MKGMIDARIEWLRELGRAGMPYPGDRGLDAFEAGWNAAHRSDTATTELETLRGLINTPEIDAFLRAVHLEAVHQVERWGTTDDRAKRPADWFWLIGYLAGKALHSQVGGNTEKALHHCISTAAALYNWHCAIKGVDVRMCPGSSDVERIVEAAFPGTAKAAVVAAPNSDDARDAARYRWLRERVTYRDQETLSPAKYYYRHWFHDTAYKMLADTAAGMFDASVDEGMKPRSGERNCE